MSGVERDDPYVIEVASALSRLGNAIRGGNGAVTLSAASYEGEQRGLRGYAILRQVIDWLLFHLKGEHDHCRNAYDWHALKGLVPQRSTLHAADPV